MDEKLLERRTLNRVRKQKQRAREKKARQILDLEEESQATDEEYRRLNLHFIGEESPGIDAKTHDAELAIHREFARALAINDVQPAETLRSFAKRVFEAWLRQPNGAWCDGQKQTPYHLPGWVLAFDRSRQEFSGFHGFDARKFKSFEEMWKPPKGCTGGEPIDVTTLPELPPKKQILQEHV